MKSYSTFLFGLVGSSLVVLLGFGLFIGLVGQAVQAANNAPAGECSAAMASPQDTVTAPAKLASPTANEESLCYPASGHGAQVVRWAKAMADALYVNPACGKRRGGSCNDTWYTSAFPQPVIAYGQAWCQSHGDCSDWANGTYQCVSFVRGAYSQIYPMRLSNDAFNLWYTYQHQPDWQEIPAAATADPAQRFLPEPGDVMVFKDNFVGHVAIIMAVQPPVHGKNGWVEFANANSSSAYDRMPLLPNLLVDTSAWNSTDPHYSNTYIVWGYLRPRPTVSQRLVRISQLDPGQYASQSEYATWAYSACSAAAMTEVLNAYGGHYRIHDVLAVERSLTIPGSSPPTPYITPQGGLMAEAGIAATMQRFGFTTHWGDHWQLSQVLAMANSGIPVIVSWPPDRYAGGHIVVVTGGDSSQITLADSSSWNRRTLSVSQFLSWWGGFAAITTPIA